MVDAMKVKRSINFATLQGYVIFETELYIIDNLIYSNFGIYGWTLVLVVPKVYVKANTRLKSTC